MNLNHASSQQKTTDKTLTHTVYNLKTENNMFRLKLHQKEGDRAREQKT